WRRVGFAFATAAGVGNVVNGGHLEVTLALFLFTFFTFLAFLAAGSFFLTDLAAALGPGSMQLYLVANVLAQVVQAANLNFSRFVLQHIYAFRIRATQAAGESRPTPGVLWFFAALIISAGLRRRKERERKYGHQHHK